MWHCESFKFINLNPLSHPVRRIKMRESSEGQDQLQFTADSVRGSCSKSSSSSILLLLLSLSLLLTIIIIMIIIIYQN